MRRLIICIVVLMMAGSAVAADRVVRASATRMPAWLGGMEEGYIIVTADAASLDAAQQKAINQVREQIIAAVATRVQSRTTITMHEVTHNGTIDSHRELDSRLSIQAADIPYLAEVSPSHATAYYWAKIRRPDKSTYYTYNLKYPLPDEQLRRLVREYEDRQQAINDTILAFADVDLGVYDDLSSMLKQHSRLKVFAAGLNEEDERRNLCAVIRRSYEQQLQQNLHIVVHSSDKQSTLVELYYGQRPLTNSLLPSLKTNCLLQMERRHEGNNCRITYDAESGCYADDQNWLKITYTVLGKKYSTTCTIK